MQKLSFTPINSEVYLFINKSLRAYTLIYVDNNVIAAPNKKITKQVRNVLSKVCPLKDLSEATKFLGFQIIRDHVNNQVFINQTKYAKAILTRFRYKDINPVKTPIASHKELPTT
ncbi:hypothetical protein CGLO_03522 [Colletotrichum gloeosporioides Cg-14]|uniref:Reverse transcriptase Ty1/copia-type domain-containing protein n=1 Tax=Colletotrichum gloeosporioides (strain Cg-14) TaxID=1237896 RepID=T0KVD8_COLGC|nr:hypothetical protein CGLO_03522 [Colletotrichum gloeosporioides Cg-14]